MFKDSCVTQLSPWRAGEQSTSFPERIFPVFVGSGSTCMGLDASGLQGVNHRVQQAYGSAERAGDLYVIRHGMIGDQLYENCALPLGYMDWEMELDGDLIASDNLADKAVLWERELLLDQAKVVTTMMFHNRLRLRIGVWIPYGGQSPVVEVELQGRPYMAKPLERELQATFRLRMNPRTRQGAPLYSGFERNDDALTLDFIGSHENYRVDYTFANDRGLKPAFADGGSFGIEWKTSVGHEAVTLAACLGIGESASIDDLEELRTRHAAGWKQFYGSLADVKGVSDKEAYLLHHSYYLIRSGMEFAKGITIGTPFYHPWCWKSSVFWDSHFVSDGLLRAGDVEDVDTFLGYLSRTMKPSGKPFPWMMQYDGRSTIEEERDFAPLVISAHAMTAIKVYEYNRDRKQLENVIFPLLERTSEYAADFMFQEVDGRWIVSMPVSNDVVDDVALEINQTYTNAWFLSVFKKTVEYAELLGAGEKIAAKLKPILEGYYLEQTDDVYLHSQNLAIQDLHCASWVPFLLYPTEATPFVYIEKLRRTRELDNFPDLYMRKQGDFQPWGNFMQSSSDLRLGEVEKARSVFNDGLNYTFGAGLFSEVGPRQETVALPPYITAHGNYISNLFGFFVRDSIWDGAIGIFVRLPADLKERDIAIRGISCIGGIRVVEASYSRRSVSVLLAGSFAGRSLTLPVPYAADDSALEVRVNDASYPFERSADGETIALLLQDNQATCEITVFA